MESGHRGSAWAWKLTRSRLGAGGALTPALQTPSVCAWASALPLLSPPPP